MNRDHLLFLTIGALAGFIAGYLLHEVMAARQPPPRWAAAAGPAAAAAGMAPGPGGAAMAGAAAAGGAPAMEEIQRLREHVEKNPDDAEAVLLLANLNFDIRSWQRARELYERYLKLRPGNADVMTDLGVCLRELGEFQRALALFREAEAVAPDHWQARYNQVVVLAFDLQDLTAAGEALAELRRLQPANPSVEELAAEIERRRRAA